MRVIPAEVPLDLPSDAERRVHSLLSELDWPGWTALHSLRLARHEYQQVGEIDFLLVGPAGLFVLEVKGGRITQADGVWIHTDRYAESHRKNRSPFTQAQQGAFSLLKRIKTSIPSMERVRLGWAVSFPDQPFPDRSVEWDAAEVIDRPCHESPARFESALEQMVDHARHADRHTHCRDLAPKAAQAIVDLCRPDFDRIPSLAHRAQDLARETVQLTSAQFRFIDAAAANNRVICRGGAGTGKSLLALESLRREVSEGRSALLTVRSRSVAGFLRSRYDGPAGGEAKVLPFDQIGSISEPVDALIVDEAQDLMNIDDLATLDEVVAGGLSNGRWRVFLDPNHQTGLVGSFDAAAYELLATAGASLIDLPDNCRNPRPVVDDVTNVLAVKVGEPRVGAGPAVVWDWWSDAASGAAMLGAAIEQLLEAGADKTDIVVLTDGDPLADPVVAALSSRIRSVLHPVTEATPWRPTSHVRAARLGLFKGLEAPFVITLATGGAESEARDLRNALYVAMTRTTTGLHVLLPDDRRSAVTELSRQ